MATLTQYVATKFVTQECLTCGMQFAMTEMMDTERRRDGNNFCCPAGHWQSYTEPLVKKLERELAQERAKHDQTRAAQRAATDEIQRLKNRAGMGQCPCCEGTFRNLRNHMQRKHPNFAPPATGSKKTAKTG